LELELKLDREVIGQLTVPQDRILFYMGVGWSTRVLIAVEPVKSFESLGPDQALIIPSVDERPGALEEVNNL
jgi:hypothetical protein